MCACLSMPCLNRLGSKLFERPSYITVFTFVGLFARFSVNKITQEVMDRFS